jgi:hypothetical protein
MARLSRNALRCNHCNTVIESVHRHDFVWCKCLPDSSTRVFTDGGLDYVRRGCGEHANFTDLCEFVEDDE